MKILFRISFVLVCASLSYSVGMAQGSTPSGALTQFYRFDQSHPHAFTRANLNARKKWLSPALFQLFLNELDREKAYLGEHPGDKPFYGDGLPFRPYDEVCREGRKAVHKRIAYGKAVISGDGAEIPVTFAFPKPCKDPDRVSYTVRLIKVGRSWLIDDVVFSDTASLVKDLNRADY